MLWTLWLQGWDEAPLAVRRCLDNLRRANPGWRVEALDRGRLGEYLPAPTLAHLDTLPLSPAHHSDLVRLLLLQRHGGVWLDSTCLCAVPLECWVHEVAGEGFFAFARPAPDRELSNWCLAAPPDDPVIDALVAACLGYWSAREGAHDYFWFHRLFATLLRHDPVVAERWAGAPTVSAAHRFHYGPKASRLLEPPTDEDVEALRDPPAPVFKLTSRLEGGERVPAGSLIAHLLDLDPLEPARGHAVRTRFETTAGARSRTVRTGEHPSADAPPVTASPIIVLGMHRSGTSALAGSLEEAGVELGDVVQHAPDNLKGSRESRRLMSLHEDLLQRAGGSWREPPERVRWEAVHRALRDAHLESFAGRGRWGFKDPRTLLVLDGWLAACPEATLVGIFRHPFHVAESLHRRNGIDHEEGLELWLRYNRLLHWYRDNRAPFPLIEFAEDAADVARQLRSLVDALGLPEPPGTFFDDAMRRREPPELPPSPRTARALELHGRLQALRTFDP